MTRIILIHHMNTTLPPLFEYLVVHIYAMNWIKNLIASSVILLILDFIYISVNRGAFEKQVTHIQRVVLQLRVWPTILCYLLLIFGLNYFILRNRRPVLDAFLLGIVIYGVFDTTNMALFKKWGVNLALMDTLWGGVLMALTTAIVYAL